MGADVIILIEPKVGGKAVKENRRLTLPALSTRNRFAHVPAFGDSRNGLKATPGAWGTHGIAADEMTASLI